MPQWAMALCVMKDWLLATENLSQFPLHMQQRIIDLRDRTSVIIASDNWCYAPLPHHEYLHQRPMNIGGEKPPEETP